jgi:transposase
VGLSRLKAVRALRAIYLEPDQFPELARAALHGLATQLEALGREIERLEARIVAWHRDDETSRRLATIPGIGPITASAIAASAPDPSLFQSGRQFAVWLGLTPRAHSSGGKERRVGGLPFAAPSRGDAACVQCLGDAGGAGNTLGADGLDNRG